MILHPSALMDQHIHKAEVLRTEKFVFSTCIRVSVMSKFSEEDILDQGELL